MDKNKVKRLIEAAKLIQEHCGQADCESCIFNGYSSGCMFTYEPYVYTNEYAPHNWDIPVIREGQ